MAEVVINDLNKYYGKNHVLKGVTFELYEGERVGLLGKNGSGKTTLFKVLTGQEPFESGLVSIARNRTTAILDQIPDYPEVFSTQDVILTAFERTLRLSKEMKTLELLMQQNYEQEYLKKYGAMQMEFEAADGYTMDSIIDRVCYGLGVSAELREKPFGVLSGGEKTRVNLARILLRKPDILLLDEPTNHLDIKAIEWLEEFLAEYKGTILIVSHDRFFLDKTISRVVELVEGKVEHYPGNYSYYVHEKEERATLQLEQFEQQQKKVDQLEKAAKRMHEWANRADNPAMHKRAFAIEKRIVRMDKVEKPREEKQIGAEFSEWNFSGKEVIQLENVRKAFGGKVVVDVPDILIRKNERVAVIGDNGSGKTTLLKLITGELEPDNGAVKVGNSIKTAYLQQLITFDNPELSILETVRYVLETNEEKAKQVLAPFNFKGKDVIKTVNILSGGEKSRLRLCLLMQTDCNLLLLDEPTNHLDIASREWIEKSVSGFKGTIVFVSHDRYFIDRFADRIWEMNEGKITDFKGTYREFNEQKQREALKQIQKEENAKKNDKISRVRQLDPVLQQKNKEIKAANERLKLEGAIEGLDEQIKLIDTQLEENSSDYKQLEELMGERSNLAHELDLLYKRWMEI